jgi:hypothetical protein
MTDGRVNLSYKDVTDGRYGRFYPLGIGCN